MLRRVEPPRQVGRRLIRSRSPMPIGLPQASGRHVERGQPAFPIDPSIDAHEMPLVKNVPSSLGGVTAYASLPRSMGLRETLSKGFPAEYFGRLLCQRFPWQVAGVHEEVLWQFENGDTRAEKCDVVFGDLSRLLGLVRIEGRAASEGQPIAQHAAVTVENRKKHFLMISEDRYQLRLRPEREQPVNHTPTVRPAIDVVTKSHEDVIGCRHNLCQQGVKRRRETVDISDSDDTLHFSSRQVVGAEGRWGIA